MNHPDNALQSAFLDALTRRVARDSGGRITLPTGTVDLAQVAQVLRAIDCASEESS